VDSSGVDVLAKTDGPAEATNTLATPLMKRPTWEQAEGHYRLASGGSKRSKHSILPFTPSMRRASLYCSILQPIW
jgi:hypothetical protein